MSRPKQDQWPIALRSAMELLATAGIGDAPWRFTGGSALATIYHHRFSRDADVFFDHQVDLQSAESAIKDKFDYPTKLSGAFSLKVFLPNGCHVDLVNAPQLTAKPVLPMNFEGQIVRREDPVEILAKKIRFRGGEATPRDIFDHAVISRLQDGQWQTAAVASGYGGIAKLREALDAGPDTFVATAISEIATPNAFDPRDIWERTNAAVTASMPSVLWADVIRQQARDHQNIFHGERVARAVERAVELDPAMTRASDAIRALSALDELSPEQSVAALKAALASSPGFARQLDELSEANQWALALSREELNDVLSTLANQSNLRLDSLLASRLLRPADESALAAERFRDQRIFPSTSSADTLRVALDHAQQTSEDAIRKIQKYGQLPASTLLRNKMATAGRPTFSGHLPDVIRAMTPTGKHAAEAQQFLSLLAANPEMAAARDAAVRSLSAYETAWLDVGQVAASSESMSLDAIWERFNGQSTAIREAGKEVPIDMGVSAADRVREIERRMSPALANIFQPPNAGPDSPANKSIPKPRR